MVGFIAEFCLRFYVHSSTNLNFAEAIGGVWEV